MLSEKKSPEIFEPTFWALKQVQLIKISLELKRKVQESEEPWFWTYLKRTWFLKKANKICITIFFWKAVFKFLSYYATGPVQAMRYNRLGEETELKSENRDPSAEFQKLISNY